MNIIPVLDIAGGRVVHAVGGDRHHYAAIRTTLGSSDAPAELAAALLASTSSTWLYVADIGAYQGRSRDWQALQVLGATCAAAAAGLMIDFGIIDSIDASSAFELLDQTLVANYKLIVALESLQELSELERIVQAYGPRTVFSLDLRDGKVRAADSDYAQRLPVAIATTVIEMGIDEIIVLDTGDVGSREGCSSAEVCRAIRRIHADVRLVGGGGIRDRSDVNLLLDAGCDAVLVASALHQQTLR